MKKAAIVIVCNGAPFITKQLDNIYNEVDEIIIAEGADAWFSKVIKSKRSTDGTIELIKGYPDIDKKIKMIHVSSNKNGMVKFAVDQTDADLLYQVDVDEFIRPEGIKLAFEMLHKRPNVGVPQRWFYKWHDTYLEGARPYKCRAIPIRFYQNKKVSGLYPSHIPCNGYRKANQKGNKHVGVPFVNLPFNMYAYHYLALYRGQLSDKMKYYIARDRINSKILTNRVGEFDKVTRKSIDTKIHSYSSFLRLEENPFIKF